MKKLFNSKRNTFVSFLQSVYLSVRLFFTNDLITSASSCAFGFLFSFIPVVMMTAVILVRFLHADQNTVDAIVGFFPAIENISDSNIEKVVNTLASIRTITNFEIFLSFAIIWMARRCFSSIAAGLNKIFGQEQKARPVLRQIFIVVGEVASIVLIAVLIFMFGTARTIKVMPIFDPIFHIPQLELFSSIVTKSAGDLFPFALLFFLVTAAYNVGIRSKRHIITAFFCSAGCTFSFWLLLKLFRVFMDVNKYNLIYGVLSNVIVLLMEVFFFFIIFLFFAQWLYVFQCFDTLLLDQIYLLPEEHEDRLSVNLKRLLFIRPSYLLKENENVIKLKAGEYIYRKNEPSEFVYYVAEGEIVLSTESTLDSAPRGSFFGEVSCILNENRIESAFARTDSIAIRISKEKFEALVRRSNKVSNKLLEEIRRYI